MEIQTAEYLDTVTIKAAPNYTASPASNKYRVDQVTIYKTGEPSTTVSPVSGNGPFTFTMPYYPVTVNVTFTNTYSIVRDPSNSGTNAANNGTFWVSTTFTGNAGSHQTNGTAGNSYYVRTSPTNSTGNTWRVYSKENAEIRNVRLSFRAEPYTSSEFFCGSVDTIPRGRYAELPLLADFSPAVLRFTDNGRILGELVIRYNFLGQERVSVSAVTVASYNRNTVTEGDTAALAAFISPTSPETLEYSKYIAGLSRARRRTGHNQ